MVEKKKRSGGGRNGARMLDLVRESFTQRRTLGRRAEASQAYLGNSSRQKEQQVQTL
jgi:hypothetical protein